MDKFAKYEIYKYDNLEIIKTEDDVISEYPMTIFINDREYATLLCTPEHLEELVVGYLRSDYLIESFEDLESLIIDESKGIAHVEIKDASLLEEEIFRKRYITSGCSSSAVFYDTLDAIKLKRKEIDLNEPKIKMESLFKMMELVNQNSELFKQTGGIHIAGLFDYYNNMYLIEDIGRHNAVDKIIGKMTIDGISPDCKVIVVSGRISSDMVLKCAKTNINTIVSRSAPMDKAIDIAKKLNLTLVGFLRGKRANIYSGIERIDVL